DAAAGPARAPDAPDGRASLDRGAGHLQGTRGDIQATASRGGPCSAIAPVSAKAPGGSAGPAGAPRTANGRASLERGAGSPQATSGQIQATAPGDAPRPARPPAPGKRTEPGPAFASDTPRAANVPVRAEAGLADRRSAGGLVQATASR